MVEGISELPTVLTSFDTVHKSNCRGASPPLLNHGLHAIDATSDVHPTRWLICAQVRHARRGAGTPRRVRPVRAALRVAAVLRHLGPRHHRRHAGRDEAAARLARRRADVPQWPLLDGASVQSPRGAPKGVVRLAVRKCNSLRTRDGATTSTPSTRREHRNKYLEINLHTTD